MPSLAMMAPETLRILNGGGYYSGKNYDGHGQKREAEFAVESPNIGNNREGFHRSLYHELGHTAVNWIEGKPYVDRKKYAEYRTTEVKKIHGMLDLYYGMDWESAQKFKKGSPLVLLGDISEEYVKEKEDALEGYLGSKLPEIEDPELVNNGGFRLNRLIHAVGNRRQELLKSNPDNIYDIESPYVFPLTDMLNRAGEELGHYFIGPVQRDGGGFPGNEYVPEFAQDALTKANEEVQLAQLKAFSSLSDTELINFSTASDAIRNHLQLDAALVNS